MLRSYADCAKHFTYVLTLYQWSQIEQTAKSSIQEKKIRVVFLPAEGSEGAAYSSAASNGTSHIDDSHAYSSPSPQPQTPKRGVDGPVSRFEDRPTDSRSLGEASDAAYNPAQERSYISSAAVPTSADQLKQQLAEAKAQISRLQSESQDQTLRQRKTDAVNQDSRERITTGTTGLGIKQASAGGVPVQVAAGLCLLCFLIAYFFF